jgi:hypothetical protein
MNRRLSKARDLHILAEGRWLRLIPREPHAEIFCLAARYVLALLQYGPPQ